MALFSKRHYEFLERFIRSERELSRQHGAIVGAMSHGAIYRLAEELVKDNPNFSVLRFMDAISDIAPKLPQTGSEIPADNFDLSWDPTKD